VDGVYHLAGVTSGGIKEDASLGDRSFDTRVDVFAEWIDEPHNRSSILIYRLTERGTTSDALATSKWRGRGYLVVDCAARVAISVTTRQSGREQSVVREDWPLAAPLAQATIFTTNQLYSALAAQQTAPAAGAWYQVAGKAHGLLAGQVYARTGKGESLRLTDGLLAQARLATRLDTKRSDVLLDTDLATDVAAALVAELTPAAAAAAPLAIPPAAADLPAPAVQVYRLSGNARQEGLFSQDRYRLGGYLLLDRGQQRAALLLVTTSRTGSSLETVSLDDDWALALLGEVGGPRPRLVLLASHPTLYSYTRCLFTGATRDGLAKRLAGSIVVVDDQEVTGADHRQTYTLTARHDAPLTATAAGSTLDTVLDDLAATLD
jgi:hypothetical protein